MVTLSRFVNLDVVLRSNSDLKPLIEHLGPKVVVLAHETYEQPFLLNLELSDSDSTKNVGWCTLQFLTLIEAFPAEVRELWNGCMSRTFSCGFEGGSDYPGFDTTITADLLLRIARLGADIGITVYPYRTD